VVGRRRFARQQHRARRRGPGRHQGLPVQDQFLGGDEGHRVPRHHLVGDDLRGGSEADRGSRNQPDRRSREALGRGQGRRDDLVRGSGGGDQEVLPCRGPRFQCALGGEPSVAPLGEDRLAQVHALGGDQASQALLAGGAHTQGNPGAVDGGHVLHLDQEFTPASHPGCAGVDGHPASGGLAGDHRDSLHQHGAGHAEVDQVPALQRA